MLLIRTFPTENRHGNPVRTAQITLHLLLKISKGIEAQIVVKAFLVVSVAPLDLSVMPRCSDADELMYHVVTFTEKVKGMNSIRFCGVGKLRTVVGLNDFGSIPKECNGASDKIYGGITAMLPVSEEKALSGCFLNHGVLIELLIILAGIASGWDEFDVHLPFDTKLFGGVIGLVVLWFILCGLDLFTESKPDKYAIERPGMTGIRFIPEQLAVKLSYGYIGIPSVVVFYPLELLLRVGIRMRCMRAVRFWHERFSCTVIQSIPPHQGCFGDMIPPANVGNVLCLSIDLNRMYFC